MCDITAELFQTALDIYNATDGLYAPTVYASDTTLSASSDANHTYLVDGVVYCRIIDPRTGYPIHMPQGDAPQRGIACVTLLGPSAAYNDAPSTARCALWVRRAPWRISISFSQTSPIPRSLPTCHPPYAFLRMRPAVWLRASRKARGNRIHRLLIFPGTEGNERMSKNRDRIIQSALNLFSQKDFDSVTIKDICADAQVANSTFYYHFKTKEELMDCLCCCR